MALLAAAALPAFAVDPLFFYEENIGQDSTGVLYRVQGASQPVYLTSDSVYIAPPLAFQVLQLRFTDHATAVQSVERWPGILNRFTGAAANWRRNIPAHRQVQYTAVQPGIDVLFGESGGIPALTFVVQPGGDVSLATLAGNDVTQSKVDANGAWVISQAFGGWTIAKPSAWQLQGTTKIAVNAGFRVISNERAGFDAPSYDHTRALYIQIILPGLQAPSRTYTGMKDSAGNTYVAAGLSSTTVCFVNTGGGRVLCPDAGVAALRPNGEPLFWSILAGRYEDSTAGNVVLNGEGNVIATGNTGSDDFPVTSDALQGTNAGRLGPMRQFGPEYIDGDAFLSILNPVNGDLLYSTFYGGPDAEYPTGLFAGPGSIVTVPLLGSATFPTTPGAWMTVPDRGGAVSAGAIFQFDTAAKKLRFATFVPSTMALHDGGPGGGLYLTGSAVDGAFTTEGALQRQFGGGASDGYLIRLGPDGAPAAATYYGGQLTDSLSNMVVDGLGNVWVEGRSQVSPFGPTERDQHYLLHMRGDGSGLLAPPIPLPYLGSFALARDGSILYYSDPAIFHRVRAGCGTLGVGYLQAYGPDGSLRLAAYLPPTASTDLDQIYTDALARYSQPAPDAPALTYLAGAAYRGNTCRVSPGEIVSLFGLGLGPETPASGAPGANGDFPTTLGGARVLVNGAPAPLLYAHSWQINAVIPFALSAGQPVTITVDYQGKQASLTVDTMAAGFSLFAYSGEGTGAAAAFNQDGSLNSETNPAQRGSIVVVFGTGGGVTTPASRDGGLAPVVAPELLPKPAGTTTVQLLDKYNADILYAGAAPGLINGLTQVNFRIPADLPLTGPVALPVDISVGGVPSENTAKIWVK